ncbi:hypothetical protein B9G38_16900, partial [Halorubrum sp. SD612]
MAVFDPDTARSRRVRLAAVGLVALAAVATAGAFAADPSESVPEPVRFADAVELGLASEPDPLAARDRTRP